MNSVESFSSVSGEGSPIRKSPDIMPVCGSPGLIAAYHVLHRLPLPRHPPYALSSLIINLPKALFYKYLNSLFVDLPINIQLSKTSNAPLNCKFSFAIPLREMEMIGFEPTASALQGRRSPN